MYVRISPRQEEAVDAKMWGTKQHRLASYAESHLMLGNCVVFENQKEAETRIRHTPENAEKTGASTQSGAVASNAVQLDADLLAIIDAWPTLTAAIKAKLLKLIRSAPDTGPRRGPPTPT